ncbi:hypothetical protein LAZ67_6003290 [Cordylochernes scorpioides]|uniref:DUF5641 domain-containing protein n=1 Tax=Cordylochernes scorpioides TaxID=51811 RepID=A0ABY6KMC7_9ARAC|nr:hypothetical protein LAZ67_6003290 [Cordylochernes scorpioides]
MEMIKKKRTLLRTSVTRSVKEIETELEKECPSSEAIRASYRILENKGKRLEREIGHKITGEWDSAKTGQEGLAACRLPKISLAIYDGTCLDWLGWWSQFKTIHENPGISEVDNFRYLMQSIKKGTRAERLVRSYPLTKENYPKVIKALKDRFGDSTILTDVYVRQLLKLVVNNIFGVTRGEYPAECAYFLYPMVEPSLPEDLLRTWQRSALAGYDVEDGELPPTVDKRLTSLLEFMRREVKREQSLGYIRDGLRELSCMRTNGHYVTKMHAAEVKRNTEKVDPHCIICQGGHWIQRCPKWCAMPQPRTKPQNLPEKKLENTRLEDKMVPVNEQEVAYTGMHVRTAILKALLATALVRIMNNRGEGMVVQVLLDQGSQSSFISRDVLQHLNTTITRINAQVYGINDTKGELVRELASCRLESLTQPGWTIPVQALVVNKMTRMLPSQDLCLSIPASWHSLPLADPQFERSRKIDMILGTDVYRQLLLPDIKRQRQGQLCAQNTRLGWVILGKLPLVDQSSPHLVYHISVKYEDSLKDILKRFWEVEEIPIKRRSSAEEEFCEQLYQSEVKRTRTGRYVVPLPLDQKIAESDLFGLSVAICFRRQLAMERRLDRNVYLRGEYCSFMKDYEELGHMTPLPEQVARDVEGCCFLPHHAVRGMQPDKKLRVIFYAATRTTNGFSLNDRLYAGPKLQNDISSVLLRWRLPKIVMVADIEKMYRQILVRPQDALRQRILWRQNARETMRPYQLNTVTYGTSPAPFLALRTLIQLAKDDGHLYPKAVEAIRRDTYVDDILNGAENSLEAMGLQRELIDVLRCDYSIDWIKTLSRTLPTFVGNRVSEIQACRKIKQWRHVPSKDNPVDIASQMTMGSGLRDSQLWWKGSTQLAASPKLWPEMPNIQAHCDETEALISSRIVAWIMRFGKNCRARDGQVRSYLTLVELREAQKRIVLDVQSHYFREELKSLKDSDIVKRSSPIYALNSFLNIYGVIRVGGRLKWAPTLTSEQKHPALMPSKGRIAQMIIQEVHARTLHGGTTNRFGCHASKSGNRILTRWQLVQNLLQHLWRKWSRDYLHNLQQHHKWKTSSPNVPPAKWLKGRIIEDNPGKDGLVRVATVKTSLGVLRRPLVKLVMLPVAPSEFDGVHQTGENVEN